MDIDAKPANNEHPEANGEDNNQTSALSSRQHSGLRQLRVVERTSPALVAWLSTHDRLEPGELNDSIGDHPCTAIRSGGEDVVMPIDLEKWCRQKEIARAGVAAKFTFPVHSHMLRHACGFKLANDGHDTRGIQAYLGHRRPCREFRSPQPRQPLPQPLV
jgi:integrase